MRPTDIHTRKTVVPGDDTAMSEWLDEGEGAVAPAASDATGLALDRREFLVSVAFLAACGPAGASREARAPYPTWSDSLENAYVRTLPDGTTARYVTRRAGDKVLNSVTYGRWRMQRDDESATTGAELWVDHPDDDTLVIAGGEYTSATVQALSLPATASITLDAPVRANLAAPVGVAQPIAFSGAASIAGMSVRASVTGTYTVVERDVAVSTPSGAVRNCTRIRLEGTVPVFFGTASMTARGEVWYSPTLGVVKAVLEQPISGFGAGIVGSEGRHDLGGGWASVESVRTLGDGETRYELSTGWGADKREHAKILLELRFLDETQARTSTQPRVTELLGTALGYFPETLVRSPVSFLHPEESEQGFVYWLAYTDQAARNEPGNNDTLYQCTVRYDGAQGPLRVSSRIVYRTLAS